MKRKAVEHRRGRIGSYCRKGKSPFQHTKAYQDWRANPIPSIVVVDSEKPYRYHIEKGAAA